MTSGNSGGKGLAKRTNQARTKSPAPKPSRGKYPWDDVEEAFIFGIARSEDGLERTYLNLKDLSDHFDIPYQRVKERSAQKRWTERRHAEQVKITQERQKARTSKLVENAVEFDENAYNVAKIGVGMIMARLAEISSEMGPMKQRKARALEKMEAGEKVQPFELYSAINYREMQGLSQAAQVFQDIGRKALGTDGEKLDINIDGTVEHAVSVVEELGRDDSERLGAMFAAMERAGINLSELGSSPDVVEGEWTEDDDDTTTEDE